MHACDGGGGGTFPYQIANGRGSGPVSVCLCVHHVCSRLGGLAMCDSNMAIICVSVLQCNQWVSRPNLHPHKIIMSLGDLINAFVTILPCSYEMEIFCLDILYVMCACIVRQRYICTYVIRFLDLIRYGWTIGDYWQTFFFWNKFKCLRFSFGERFFFVLFHSFIYFWSEYENKNGGHSHF